MVDLRDFRSSSLLCGLVLERVVDVTHVYGRSSILFYIYWEVNFSGAHFMVVMRFNFIANDDQERERAFKNLVVNFE
ncbi:hypothetical protein DF281_05165 [Kurthia zopfii]|nr:hypothetical protein DF281_05165 [Kurthia zopfii]